MKKVISVLCLVALTCATAFAQQKGEDKRKDEGNGWRERVRAAQVAFLTSELDLSEAEAQSFWPVYNEVQKQRREAFEAQQKAFKALQEGIDGKDVSKLLSDYMAASKKVDAIDENAVERYKKVLPMKKVAKLILAEEKFRHQQIGRLGQGGAPFGPGGPQGMPQGGPGGPQGGNRPGPGFGNGNHGAPGSGNSGTNPPAQKQNSSI